MAATQSDTADAVKPPAAALPSSSPPTSPSLPECAPSPAPAAPPEPDMRQVSGDPPIAALATTAAAASASTPTSPMTAAPNTQPSADFPPVASSRDGDDDADEAMMELELLLLSGKRRRVKVRYDDRVGEVLERVWRDWPEDWRTSDPRPANAQALRLLYLGRFLEPKTTLDGLSVRYYTF
ncbi:hypothetical protein Rhopal_006384-T1 [Rhodotorula paludigena]|uniref:UBL3-like ubiquitin domain-containing protein n=1 Tax=Rhodotorula paludigena TaxID=86838 RepID=A0AAV5GL79_9BASI|nr:hypothetical protein Rhopal_006384-T1 [Rhodotorula paludigena]